MTRFMNALTAKRASLGKDEKGFTLIELLVVVIIIGVLAAIAIPVYIGVQNNAKDSSAQSDLTNAKIAVIAYYTDKGSFPTTIDSATLKDYGFSGSGVTAGTVGVQAIGNFCLTKTGNVAFYINQDASANKTKMSNCS